VHRLQNILILSILAACSSRESDTTHSFRIYEKDGVTIAETTGGPKYTGELFWYEQILVLEEDPEWEESLLYHPSHFLMDEDGFYYVADGGNERIAIFDPEGRYSHSIGRQGSGPGEFRQMEIQSVRRGVVSVWDFALRRTTRFYTDGRVLGVTPLPITTARQILGLFHAPDERLVVLTLEIPADGDHWEHEQAHATVFSPRGDSLWSRDFGWVRSRFLSTERAGDVEYQWPAWYYYGPRPWGAYDLQGKIVYTAGIDPVVDIYNLDGIHVRQIQLGLKPESPTREDEERVRSFLNEQVKRAAGSSSQGRWKSDLDKIRIPEYKAFWHGIEVDDAGYIWLMKPEHRYAINDDTIPTFTYFIISPDGEYLGQTQRLKEGRIRVSHGHLLVISSDQESGEHHLIVYAIRPAVEGLRYP